MNQKKTGHHYIPNRSYLANFSDASGKVWVLDETNRIYATNPGNIFKEQHFYTIKLSTGGGSLVVENTLAIIEGKFADIYRNKISKSIPLTIEEKVNVSVFLGALHLRTKNRREGLDAALKNLRTQMDKWKQIFLRNKKARDFAATQPQGQGERIGLDDVNEAIENIGDVHNTTIMESLPQIAQRIFDLDWQYLPAPEGEVFVTTDDPLRVLRPEAIKEYGPNAIGSLPSLEYTDAEITVPLSSTLALYGATKGVGDGMLVIDKRQLDQINYRTMMYSKDKIVACESQILERIRQQIADAKRNSD